MHFEIMQTNSSGIDSTSVNDATELSHKIKVFYFFWNGQ